MSAIFGLVNLSGEPVAAIALARMSAALAVHGPDATGSWTQGCIGLGQRLMRFTPEDRFEQQPLVSRDGRRVLVCNGRIDNRPELGRELGIPAQAACAMPDSQFIELAYEKWGEGCPQHLIGPFTFALWDQRTQSFMLARSAIASPSLFYCSTPQACAFATMPKGLFALPFVSRQLDEQYLANYLAGTPMEAGTSFYRAIRRLSPGELLVIQQGRLTVTPYWQPDLKRERRYPHDEDYILAFDELFERVVADHMRSLTPIGVMMSGGLDSASIAATAAQSLARQGERLAAFTEVPRAGFDGVILKDRYADETPYVQAMAQMYANLDLNLIHTGRDHYLDRLDEFFQAAEAPFRNASNRVWYEAILRAAQQLGVRVVLNGGQGNLTISWDGDGLIAQLVRAGKWRQAWRQARALADHGRARSPARALLSRGILPLLPDGPYFALERLRQSERAAMNPHSPLFAYSPIHPDFAAEQHVIEQARDSRARFRLRADTRALRLRTILGTSRAGEGLDAGYQALFGVAEREPACDVRLVEFCLALPEEQYQHDGQTRRLIRRVMDKRLPAAVLENRQRGLQAADWFERLDGAQARILDELTRIEQSDLARRALDLARLRRLVEQMPHTGRDARQLFADYRGVLELGLMTGCFIRWVETGPCSAA